MHCEKCGTQLKGNENFCFKCGNEIKNTNSPITISKTSNGKKTASIVLGIVSLVGIFLIIFSPISFIISLIGLIIGIIANKEVSNVAGIVLNAIGLFLSLIVTAIIALIFIIIINVSKNVDTNNIRNFEDIPNFNFDDFPWGDIINEFGLENQF